MPNKFCFEKDALFKVLKNTEVKNLERLIKFQGNS